MDLAGKPLLQRLWDRILLSKTVNHFVVATTANYDDNLVKWLSDNSFPFIVAMKVTYCPFYFASKPYNPDVIVRMAADDPLKDAEIIDDAVQLLADSDDIDYLKYA